MYLFSQHSAAKEEDRVEGEQGCIMSPSIKQNSEKGCGVRLCARESSLAVDCQLLNLALCN